MDRDYEEDFEAYEYEYEDEAPAGNAGIIDLTARTPRRVRHGTRPPGTIDAVVLHQMACCFRPRNPQQRFLTVEAHYAIGHDGRIYQLHPTSSLLWTSNGFNRRSVGVEFAGNFPNVRGRWWNGSRMGRNQVTRRQVDAGRRLLRHLRSTLGIRYVFAHRQSSGSRDNDPGPDIWYNVGQWGVSNLGLSDGGPSFRIGSGNPILPAWRTWARPLVPELGAAFETELSETEIVHDLESSGPRPAAPVEGHSGCACGGRAGAAREG